MKEGHKQLHQWSFDLAASPEDLWPYLSDTNRIFHKLGANPVRPTAVSRNVPKGYLELSHEKLNSYVTWVEEPYIWEAPYRFSVLRNYKAGILHSLNISMESKPADWGASVIVKVSIVPSSPLFNFPVKLYTDYLVKRRLNKYLEEVEIAINNDIKPYELRKKEKLQRATKRKLKDLQNKLIKASKRSRIVFRLMDMLVYAEDEDLQTIHPYALAEYWGEKKFSVLNVFLHAAKLDILDFGWNICCPACKSAKHHFRKMQEARIHLYCDDCEREYTMDLNRNMHLVFKPHPLIRKISAKQYCVGGPQSKPHRVIQQHIDVGSNQYPQIELDEATYLFRTHNHGGHLILHVREDGADNINIILTNDDLGEQEFTISTTPNLVIQNHSSKKVVIFLDKVNWKSEAIYASEVCSSLDFKTLFAKETLKETAKVKASEVTMLFTDLMNSTELYLQEGDESAIGRVMGHFKIIQQIVAEERGGIVKTIGDSVMAVFWQPVSALKAVQRIQQIFSNSSAMGDDFKIKAGIHFGDCTAVNLNGRIDYFGTTVNIASRLVDHASEKEVMISEAVFKHHDVQLYLQKNSDTFFVKESMKELKGFEEEEFKVKQIRLERPPMRLVI
ncbi:MAG: adenylate/guanylate cyclase domain-containing protein [Gracilimonas sp.]|nr:adenylate/guanylate cyclase domain-containing protein [Gracilimonas sp.]